MDCNILILSCGSRNKIIQYFKQNLDNLGSVYATDCSEFAPALYDADKYFIVPKMTDPNYLETILEICRTNNIKAVLTLIDPEIELLAENKEKFLALGTTPIVSSLESVQLAFDKYLTYEFLKTNNFNFIKTYNNLDIFKKDLEMGEVNFPVFVKPANGSASININKVTTLEEVELLFLNHKGLIIQEFIDGIELGADCYIDLLSGGLVSIFVKEKLKMRAGETDKSVSYKDEKLFELLKQFISLQDFKGVIDIDIFKVNGEYYISEVNPRFGGGYPHAYECGVNFPKAIISNINNSVMEPSIGEYKENIYMMKYNEVKITAL